MIEKKLLEHIISDSDQSPPDYEYLAKEAELLQTAAAKMQALSILGKTKKLMQQYGERETDIYVVSFAKSGTTLMQMLLYQLTTDGNMEFTHLYEVSPWPRYSAIVNKPLPDINGRRIIKSHDEYEMMSGIKKGKFVFPCSGFSRCHFFVLQPYQKLQ